ncbi:hypothetical protein IFM89_031415 [Coptis chinensis]|uniref:Cytochrome P450 n=1 Tax=Coptis chinensis TaxID=261450 RepID=A0A835LN93_9MAGN|nr:hypothetical protein IFM89_031415 [Coptis chinensis]
MKEDASFHVKKLLTVYPVHRGRDFDMSELCLCSSEFRPEGFLTSQANMAERFLTSQANMDVRGHHFELIPFGSGRRSCPGISFALQLMHLTLASLLQGFIFETPSGAPVNMTEGVGITNMKATPLQVLITPRLPSHLY